MKDSLFGIVHTIEDSDDEDAAEKPVEEEKLEKEAIEDVLSQAAAILTTHDGNAEGTGMPYTAVDECLQTIAFF